MADAKIVIKALAENDQLKDLNNALAEGQQSVNEMKARLRELEKQTKQGASATKEQAAEMKQLRSDLNAAAQSNSALGKAIKDTVRDIEGEVKAMADADKGARSLASSFGSFSGFTSALSTALGTFAGNVLTNVVSTMADMAQQCITLGMETQQLQSKFAAMGMSADEAASVYRQFNDVARNTNFDMNAVYQMGQQMLNLGLSSKEAAETIQLCADASAKMGTGQAGAQALANALTKIQVAGKLSDEQLLALKAQGIDTAAILAEKLGGSAAEMEEKLIRGAVDGKTAVAALTDYMHNEFDGAMSKSKENVTDMWGDLTGNIQTACGEIGSSIMDAFSQSEIIQTLINFTQDLIDMIRGDGTGAFADLGAVAQSILDAIGGALEFVCTSIKIVILVARDMYAAFKEFCAKIVDSLSWLLEPLGTIWNIVKKIVLNIGHEIKNGVQESWKQAFLHEEVEVKVKARAITGGNKPVKESTPKSSSKKSSTPKVKDTTDKDNQDAYRWLEKTQKASVDREKQLQALRQKGVAIQQQIATLTMSADEKTIANGQFQLQQLQEQQELEKEQHATAIANLEALKKQAEDFPFNGSDKVIEGLTEQRGLENELYAQRAENLENEIKLQQDTNAFDAQAIKDKLTPVQQYWQDYAKSVSSSMASAVTAVVTGEKTMGQAIAEMAKTLITNALSVLAQWTTLWAILAAFGDLDPARHASAMMFGAYEKTNGKWTKKARGGYIDGPGTTTSDSVPALLSRGEYVLRAAAVDSLGGAGYLDALNAGANPVELYGSNQAGRSVTLNISTVDADSFGDFLTRGGMDRIKQAMYDDGLMFATTSGTF